MEVMEFDCIGIGANEVSIAAAGTPNPHLPPACTGWWQYGGLLHIEPCQLVNISTCQLTAPRHKSFIFNKFIY
jgi:hypothetical protein